MKYLSTFIIGAACATVKAQGLIDTINANPEFSSFSALLQSNIGLASSLVATSSTDRRTILVPNNDAFSKLAANGSPISSLPKDIILDILYYHTLVGALTSKDFSAPKGLTVPTFLTGEQYNNRSAGAALNSVSSSSASHNGQVVVITSKGSTQSKREFNLRQLSSPGAEVTSGLAHTVNLTAIDTTWDGGKIQMVDGLVILANSRGHIRWFLVRVKLTISGFLLYRKSALKPSERGD